MFNKENIIYSKNILSLPLVWRQFALKHKYRGNHPLSILFFIFKTLIFNYKFPKKYNPSFLSDYLIIGSNPIINLLVINEINKLAHEQNKILKLAIITPTEKDYWAYEIFEDENFQELIFQKTGLKIKNIDNLIEYYSHKNNLSNVELILIEDKYKIDYIEKDFFTKGWGVYFSEEKINPPNVNDFIEYQNQIKEKIQLKCINFYIKNNVIKKLIWKKLAKKNDLNFYTPILFTKNLYLTSLPQGWMKIDFEINSNIVSYKHDLSNCSFGSASSVCVSLDNIKNHCFSDILKINLK